MVERSSNSSGVGLVLSGGGVRGMAHIGAIKALEESGIQCSHISGASVGALVGAFYAAGYPWQEILDFFKRTPIFTVQNFAFGKPGFIDTEKFYDDFLAYFPTDDFSSLEKRLYVSVTDIVGGISKIISEGPLINTILASAAFPVVLTPLKVDGTLLADGGILNNFPIEPLISRCSQIYGVYVSPLKDLGINDFKNSMDVLERAYHLSIAKSSIDKLHACDLVICPVELDRYNTFSLNHLDDIFELGYRRSIMALSDYALGET